MSIRPWTLLSSLDEKTSDEMKFSRGFLRGKPAEWFPQLATQWLPLFHQLEAGLDSGKKSAPKLIFATPRLGFPARLQRLCEIEVDGEGPRVTAPKAGSVRTVHLPAPAIDAETRRQLKALGYVNE